MTTLPSTTVRYPRPAPGVPALPGPSGALGPVGPAAAAPGMTTGDVMRVLRTNLWLIILSVIVFGIGGFGLNWYLARYHESYTAEAMMKVDPPNQFDPMGTLRNGGFADMMSVPLEQRSQARLLRSELLWGDVLSRPSSPIRKTEWFASFVRKQSNSDGTTSDLPDMAEVKKDLASNFGVVEVPDSKLIYLSMNCRKPEDAKVILQQIGERHLENQRGQMSSRNEQDLRDRRLMRDRMANSLSVMRSRLAEQQATVGTDGFQNAAGNRLSVLELQISTLNNQQVKILSDLNAAKTSYDSVMNNIRNGIDPPMVERMVRQDQEVVRQRQQLDDYDVALRSQIAELGETHPRVKSLREQRAEMQNKLDERSAEVRIQSRNEIVENVQQAVTTAQTEYDTNQKKLEALSADLADKATKMADYLATKSEVEDSKKLIDGLGVQIATLESAAAAESRAGVSWAQLPDAKEGRTFPQLKIILPAAILLGLALSLGLAFLREMMDTSVRSPRDIARVGQLNLLGMIPHEDDDPQAQAAPLALAISQAPQSVIAEQFRQVRTRLQHTASLETTRSLLVTSPGPGDGKSIVACNLAAGLALNGRRILLVDANFRRPELHKTFAVTNDVGLGNVLSSDSGFEAAVQKTNVPNLDVMTAGVKPANATELLEGSGLNDLIDRALEEYDHVIFDSGPMLVVSETVALAPRVDGVVTVVRARTNSRGLLQRMRDQLRQLKAEHLGVVLNAVRAQAGGYYNRNIKAYYAYGEDK